jgi:DNA-binding transcriptional regulator YiaG
VLTWDDQLRATMVPLSVRRMQVVTTVRRWSGVEARALREALRFTVRGFAEHLGVAARTVSKWEAAGAATFPRPDTQAMLDTVLQRAGGRAQQRFEMLCRSGVGPPVTRLRAQRCELESWTDDLERASVALSRQDFGAAGTLVERWLTRFSAAELDERGAYLHSRTLILQGGIRRDQGRLTGPGSARASFLAARSGFARLSIDSRVAQTDLALVLLTEMGGELESSARSYEAFTSDARLSARDRGLALLWMGRALSKVRDPDVTGQAIGMLRAAGETFERLDEAADWSVAQQKLALAHRARGDLGLASRFIDIAVRNKVDDSPMQHVRLNTARSHVLLTDPETRADGLRVLDGVREVAALHGLRHQLDSIAKIRAEMAVNW